MENKPKDSSESLLEFLKGKGKVELLGSMMYFKHYSHTIALSLVENKQAFLSFLLSLQNMTPKDYSLITIHQKESREFHKLFIEWMLKNPIFSQKELSYCPKLRTHEFMRMFIVAHEVPGFATSFFQFLAAYIMSR